MFHNKHNRTTSITLGTLVKTIGGLMDNHFSTTSLTSASLELQILNFQLYSDIASQSSSKILNLTVLQVDRL